MAKVKIDYGTCTGSCVVCDISLWSSNDNKPVIWPCNLEKCPYEDPKNQNRHLGFNSISMTGSGLAQIV